MSRKAEQNMSQWVKSEASYGRKRSDSRDVAMKGGRRNQQQGSGQQVQRGGGGRGKKKGGHQSQQSRKKFDSDMTIPFSRENYVKANFSFALTPNTGTGAIRGTDDVEWDDIESVFVRSDAEVVCPVCLDTVRVPRMTTCGHIYCLVCLYRLFAHSEEAWERCPLCFAFIRESGMKRVSNITMVNKISEKDAVSFVLMKRKYTSIVPLTSGSDDPDFDAGALPTVHTKRALFSRLFLETGEHVQKLVNQESKELQFQYNESVAYRDSLGVELVKRATVEVRRSLTNWDKRESSIVELEDRSPSLSSPKFDGGSSAGTQGVVGGGRRKPFPKDTTAEGDTVYFYQLDDGRLGFLDPFNLRCLRHEFGGNDAALPLDLKDVRVVGIEQLVLTPAVVKKYPFLIHLPIHASLSLIEVDIRGIVSDDTVNVFKEEFSQREKKRQAKLKADKRHDRIAKAKLRKSVMDGSYMGYAIDYREYAERQRLQEEEIERQLAHAFDASLNGHVMTEEEEAALSAALEQSNRKGVWGSHPPAMGSFAAISKQSSHFPELGATLKPSFSSPPAPSSPQTAAVSSGAWGATKRQQSKPVPSMAWGSISSSARSTRSDSSSTLSPDASPLLTCSTLPPQAKLGWETLSLETLSQTSNGKSSGKGKKGMLFSTASQRKKY